MRATDTETHTRNSSKELGKEDCATEQHSSQVRMSATIRIMNRHEGDPYNFHELRAELQNMVRGGAVVSSEFRRAKFVSDASASDRLQQKSSTEVGGQFDQMARIDPRVQSAVVD